MEITLAWFWVVKLTIIVFTYLTIRKSYKIYQKSGKWFNIWLILSVVLLILSIFNPIKINGTNSHKALSHQSAIIENQKVLPKMVTDNSFENGVKSSTTDITHTQIWK